MIKSIATLLFVVASIGAQAQTSWTLKKEESGIQVYTGTTEKSDFKSVKVVCTVKARASQVLGVMLDIPKQPKWVYNTKESRLIKMVKPNEIISYAQVNVPWPCDNRDYVSHFTISQPSPQLVIVDSRAEPDLLPVTEGVVRVKKSSAHWEMTTLPGGMLKLVYTLSFDPAGAVPAWLTNMFVTKGPMETFKNLIATVDKPEYKDKHFDFIKE